jgi:hypothetical protein
VGGDAFFDVEFKRVAEKFAHYLLAPPGERTPGACRRRRQERRHHREHLTHAAGRCPVREGDPAAGATTRANSWAVAAWSGANMIP